MVTMLYMYMYLMISMIPSFVHGTCSSNSLRIYNTQVNGVSNEGALQVCISNRWKSVCRYSWGCVDANVACRQLGYSKAISALSNGASYGSWSHSYQYYFSCHGSESTLMSCSHHYSPYCHYSSHAAGVRCAVPLANNCSTNGNVRLVGSNNSNEGIPEYCHNGHWSPLCRNFNIEEAVVTCKTLGYKPFAKLVSHSEYSWDYHHSYSLINYISCSSSASQATLHLCTVHYYSSSSCIGTCPASTHGVKCYNTSDGCTDGLVRLANGSFSQEGRIEICYNGLWASACSNGWGKADALVVCRQLGFSNSEPNVSTNAEYGSGNGPMFYSRFNCQGWESTLSACSTSYTYSHGCNSNTIAGVICTDGCIDGKLRLVGGTNEQEGTIEICHNNLWGLIADASWDDDDAEVVCRQLNLPSNGASAVKGSFYGKPDRAIHYSYVLCHGNESLITKCEKLTHTLHDGRVIYDDAQVAGVKCLPAPLNSDTTCSNNAPTITVESDCIDGNVTLTEKGILHYCYNGHWSILCSLSHKEAIVACRQLGYTQYTWGLITKETGHSMNTSLLQSINCSSSTLEPSLASCTIITGSCTCTHIIGLHCYNPVGCHEGSIHIANGSIINEGRVEVCVNGVWGSICDNGWDKTDAYVVCKQLGFSELEPVVYNGAAFGISTGPVVYSNVNCGGWENSLDECIKTSYVHLSCPGEEIAGVQCLDDCVNGDIMLMGGSVANEGNVYICVERMWGLISAEGWDHEDSNVICRQLFDTDGVVSVYAKPMRAVFLSNVACTGSEESLSLCSKIVHPLNEAKQLAKISPTVAGVSCFAEYTSKTFVVETPSVLVTLHPTAAGVTNEDGTEMLLKGLFILISCIAFIALIISFILLLVYCVRRNKIRKIQRRPLPPIGMSNILRYEEVPMDDDQCNEDNTFPSNKCVNPYDEDDSQDDDNHHSDKEPLYEQY